MSGEKTLPVIEISEEVAEFAAQLINSDVKITEKPIDTPPEKTTPLKFSYSASPSQVGVGNTALSLGANLAFPTTTKTHFENGQEQIDQVSVNLGLQAISPGSPSVQLSSRTFSFLPVNSSGIQTNLSASGLSQLRIGKGEGTIIKSDTLSFNAEFKYFPEAARTFALGASKTYKIEEETSLETTREKFLFNANLNQTSGVITSANFINIDVSYLSANAEVRYRLGNNFEINKPFGNKNPVINEASLQAYASASYVAGSLPNATQDSVAIISAGLRLEGDIILNRNSHRKNLPFSRLDIEPLQTLTISAKYGVELIGESNPIAPQAAQLGSLAAPTFEISVKANLDGVNLSKR